MQLGGVTYVNMQYTGPDKYDGPEVRAIASSRPQLLRARSAHIVVRDPSAIRAHETRMRRHQTERATVTGKGLYETEMGRHETEMGATTEMGTR
ncbi:hypothetical protein BD626DRAFT_568707 [Schizophyllum amplum]|uniref:Uncharacterized protein n=1 Tax=Schizophyllum amplum TaxID=97359 RepID=A0A550CHD4_9AGAR|nr:hypothetical protein BD626DRAFT_568707 [Auriculariopsis ampla]